MKKRFLWLGLLFVYPILPCTQTFRSIFFSVFFSSASSLRQQPPPPPVENLHPSPPLPSCSSQAGVPRDVDLFFNCLSFHFHRGILHVELPLPPYVSWFGKFPQREQRATERERQTACITNSLHVQAVYLQAVRVCLLDPPQCAA